MPAYPELRDEEMLAYILPQGSRGRDDPGADPLGFKGRTSALEAGVALPMLQAMRDGRVQVPLSRMGELAALDQYSPPLHADPRIARALELAGPGMPEDKAYDYPRYPDAASERQKPPPPSPFFGDNPPAWANRQQGAPQFWEDNITPNDPDRGADI